MRISMEALLTFIFGIIIRKYYNLFALQSMWKGLLVVLAVVAVGRSTIVITNPMVTDFENNTLTYFYANFGEVPYGKTMSFDLVVLDHGLCGDPDDLPKLTKPTYVTININYHQICPYTKRAEVAQRIGAKGLIIADPGIDYAEEDGKAIEADDGNGKKIHLTCLFISTKSFAILEKLQKLQIIAKFPVPQAMISTVTLFLSAAKRSTYIFLRQFRQQYKQLKNHIKLEPLYQTIDCPSCSSENCYLDSYCCYDYENSQSNVGQKIIMEQLRQYAIFTQKGVEQWMKYMNLFDEYCDGDWNNLEECTKNVRDRLGMGTVSVLNPVDETLRSWRSKEVHLGFDSFPEVAVNGMIYRGNFQIDDIVSTICSSLTKPPKYCSDRLIKDEPHTDKRRTNVIIILITSLFALAVVIACGFCFYRKFIKNQLTRDMASRVGEVIANYASKLSSKEKKSKHEKFVEMAQDQL